MNNNNQTVHTPARYARPILTAMTLISTVLGVWYYSHLLLVDGLHLLDVPLIALFAVLFLLITFSFWTATLGLVEILRKPRSRDELDAAPRDVTTFDLPRTAILMPIYNEDTASVFAGVRAMIESLRASGAGERFDFFVLSDTTKPDIWLEEERVWAKLVAGLPRGTRVFYRHRPQNTSRKAGNIADFCVRWGKRYRYMVVLDADSVMRGSTVIEMVRRMERDPQIGILQVPPVPIGRQSLFARMQQFSAQIYGPVFIEGFALWSQNDGNYWGHNAIIRTQPFIEHCGLPLLPGEGPLGGEILSHDFVEAALIRRAGWKVCLAHDLGGSYEECPTTILDFAQRDQRWCQGNLQHTKLLLADGMHPASRLHMGMGVMSYVASPLWLLFLVLTILHAIVGRDSQTAGDTSLGALALFAISMTMLLLPKFYGVIALVRTPERAEQLGGWDRVIASVLIETLASVLIAPIMMLLHTTFVVSTLIGHKVAWNAQPRDDRGVALADAWAVHWPHTLLAIAVVVVVGWMAPALLPWLIPVLIGPLLSIPLSMALGNAQFGQKLANRKFLLIPEEVREPAELAAKRAALAERQPATRDLFEAVLYDPAFYALHIVMLRAADVDTPIVDSDMVVAENAVRSNDTAVLSPERRRAVLGDIRAMESLHIASRLHHTRDRSRLV